LTCTADNFHSAIFLSIFRSPLACIQYFQNAR